MAVAGCPFTGARRRCPSARAWPTPSPLRGLCSCVPGAVRPAQAAIQSPPATVSPAGAAASPAKLQSQLLRRSSAHSGAGSASSSPKSVAAKMGPWWMERPDSFGWS
ncbi:forkhead box protein F2-like [Eucalyptus grandis]|uniref:forkhead box protein F2-like n=1 Tax=Eucalyptus grandis TaxID=71139 RepID=UPI00192E9D4C|nr:forkhead box protein F2-like [Eucalyptus grandis]